jgi:hypothetical protein
MIDIDKDMIDKEIFHSIIFLCEKITQNWFFAYAKLDFCVFLSRTGVTGLKKRVIISRNHLLSDNF